jgi:hypothetical protein
MRDFLINVAAGVFLTVVTWLLFHVIAPRYLAWRHRAPKLEGQWLFYDAPEQQDPVGSAVVTQSGESVKAIVTRTKSRRGAAISRSFVYRGMVRDGQLQLGFEQTDSNGFLAGNLVLKVSGDMKSLTGFTAYLDRDAGEVVAHRLWFRKH